MSGGGGVHPESRQGAEGQPGRQQHARVGPTSHNGLPSNSSVGLRSRAGGAESRTSARNAPVCRSRVDNGRMSPRVGRGRPESRSGPAATGQ